MALRKEQVLALVSLLLAVWLWKGGAASAWSKPPLSSTKQQYEQRALPKAPLLTGEAKAPPLRRWFREPSETQPLPPRELPFPSRAPAEFVALPLDPGPDLLRADLLLVSGEISKDVQLQPAAPAAAATGGDNVPRETATQETAAQKKERYAKVYDQVVLQGASEPHFGILRAPGRDPYELEQATDFDGVVLHLLEFSLSKEKLMPPEVTFGNDPQVKIKSVHLADNMRNVVGRMVRKVPPAAAYVAARVQLIDDLLLLARKDGSVYAAALEQVAILEKTSAGLVAERAKAKVLFAKGDLDGEYAVYSGIKDESGPAAAFRHEGLGNLQARLGLFAEAEANLRRAAELQPTDARPHASLAAFLRHQGRPRDAAEAGARALATYGSLTAAEDRQLVQQIVVGCMLGIGDLDAARNAVSLPGSSGDADGLATFLRASIDYAAGNVAAAKDGFRNAVTAGFGPQAQLGVAACQVRAGEWQDAMVGFEAVADQAPLLRHRALDGLALLHLRIGQFDVAATTADRALEANPLDVYAQYLRAMAQAMQGQPAAALESLVAVLRARDDFVPALAAVAELRLRQFRDGGSPEDALAALRYADRAVQLSPVARVPLYELQALAHFFAADLRGAADAFAQARDAAKDDATRLFAQAGLAIVDYAREHIDDVRPQLERMQEGLQRDHPMRQWAMATMLMIDDHAQKEQLEDRFERDEFGSIWKDLPEPGVTMQIKDHRMVIAGSFAKSAAEVGAVRDKAVEKAGKFLAVAVKMELGSTHGQDAFAGLRLRTTPANANSEFLVQLGARDGHLFWLVKEGREEPLQSPRATDAAGTGVHALEIRVEDRGENLLRLLLSIDGVVVQRKDLTMLRQNDSGRGLEITLCALAGSRPGPVDVRFDDFHLERRKD